MKARAWMTVSVAAGTTLVIAGAAANAGQQTPFAVHGGSTISYTPGPAGGLHIDGNNEFVIGTLGQGMDSNASVTFTEVANGAYTINGNGIFDQVLNPGVDTSNFTITDNTTHAVLLSGKFGTANMTGWNGASSGGVSLISNNVTYTSGVFLPTGPSVQKTGGSLSMDFTSTSPFVASTSNVAAFTGIDTISFSILTFRVPGTDSPEPTSTVPIAMGALFILACGLRKRQQVR